MMHKAGLLCGVVLLVAVCGLGMGGSSVRADQGGIGLIKVEGGVLQAITEDGNVDVLVQFNQNADLTAASSLDWISRGEIVYQALLEQAERSQERAIAVIQERGLQYRSFIATNILYVYDCDPDSVTSLAGLSEVNRIRLAQDYLVMGAETQTGIPRTAMELLATSAMVGPFQGTPEEMSWAVIDTQADEFWTTYGFAGEGVLVASIDTGAQWDHPALIESYKCQINPGDPACWFDPSGTCSEPCDGNGHGTATMGPITGENELIVPYQVGMAPEAHWIACRGCSDYSCSDVDLLTCADWVMAPGGDPANRPHLVYNGWGGMGCDGWFDVALNNWMAAGIASTFSPGGSGSSCASMGSPGDHQQVFAATAHDQGRIVAGFASRGPSCYGHDPFTKPNISAPGVTIQAPIPTNNWTVYSGTSFSSGYGAGALTLLMSCAPQLIGDPYALYDALQDGADTPPAGNCGAPPDGEGNYTYGYGYINMLTAGLLYCGESGAVTGLVTNADSSTPLEGAVIMATLSTDPFTQHSTSTNVGGIYTLTLLIGTYDLEAVYPDFLPGLATVEILTDTLILQDFPLVPEGPGMGGLDGTVTDQRTGQVLAGAEITATLASDPMNWLTTTTDDFGYYTMTLEAGEYDLLVTYLDYEPVISTVDVQEGTVTHQDFTLWDGIWHTSLPLILKN